MSEQVRPSAERRYPASHAQRKLPTMFSHCCVHPPLLRVHSFTSVTSPYKMQKRALVLMLMYQDKNSYKTNDLLQNSSLEILLVLRVTVVVNSGPVPVTGVCFCDVKLNNHIRVMSRITLLVGKTVRVLKPRWKDCQLIGDPNRNSSIIIPTDRSRIWSTPLNRRAQTRIIIIKRRSGPKIIHTKRVQTVTNP